MSSIFALLPLAMALPSLLPKSGDPDKDMRSAVANFASLGGGAMLCLVLGAVLFAFALAHHLRSIRRGRSKFDHFMLSLAALFALGANIPFLWILVA